MSRVLVYSVVDRQDPGGAQMVIARLLNSLGRSGYQVSSGWAGPGPAPEGAEEWVCPLYVRPVRQRGRPFHVPSLMRLLAGLGWRRPKLVNIHFVSEQTLYFLRLRRLFGYKTVLSAHGSDILKPADRWAGRLPSFLREADAVTVVSRNMADRVLSYGVDPRKVHVIPNGVDCDYWSPACPPDRIEKGTGPVKRLVAVGRLEPVKGFDLAIAALARLQAREPGARLCLIGAGREEPRLRALAADHGVADKVEFAGFLDRDRIRRRLREADAFVLSSRSEGMPLALLEAMACGLPALATRVGGVPEVVTPGTGVLVAPESAEALADGLSELLMDGQRMSGMARAAHRRAQDFCSRQSLAKYHRLYERLLSA